MNRFAAGLFLDLDSQTKTQTMSSTRSGNIYSKSSAVTGREILDAHYPDRPRNKKTKQPSQTPAVAAKETDEIKNTDVKNTKDNVSKTTVAKAEAAETNSFINPLKQLVHELFANYPSTSASASANLASRTQSFLSQNPDSDGQKAALDATNWIRSTSTYAKPAPEVIGKGNGYSYSEYYEHLNPAATAAWHHDQPPDISKYTRFETLVFPPNDKDTKTDMFMRIGAEWYKRVQVKSPTAATR